MNSGYKTTNTLIIGTMVLCFRLVILFLDGIFSQQQSKIQTIPAPVASSQVASTEPSTTTEPTHTVAPITEVTTILSGALHQAAGNSQIFEDLNVLEYLYTKNKNPDLLQPLVEKFLQYYQFDKANQYLSLLVQQAGDYFKLSIDPRQIIYTRLHDSTLGLDSATALNDVFSLVQEYRARNMLTHDDGLFYQGLKQLWIYDYTGATNSFSQITDPRYNDFRSSYDSALSTFVKIKDPPLYYRDGLISLTLLKNGYFVFAKRLALHALLQNENYILPYQVLAYTNFLTHNRDAAKDYFLKLADFDTSNDYLYKFLIGICYYRNGGYEQSIIYLNQVTDPTLQIDVYRYMLLGYVQNDDTTNMVRIRQDILGQSTLQPSDFALFFDQMFYLPFRTGKPFQLYSDNPQLADLFLGRCSTIFSGSQADVCTYGQVGLQLAKQNLSGIGPQLLYLTQKYQQAPLYHLLGDYYFSLKNYASAKEYYIKALSICDNTDEQVILQHKITQATDAK